MILIGIKRFCYHIQDCLKAYNGLDLMNNLRISIEDELIFDDASRSAVREHFKQWTLTAPQREQDTGPAHPQRYNFCI